MLSQVENGGLDSFYSFAIKVQVARKIGAYLKLRDEDYLVVKEATLFNDDALEQIQLTVPDVKLEQITQKFESNTVKAQGSGPNLENSNNIINEIDKIIGIYEKSSGPKEKIPFNEILISSVDPKISMDIPDTRKSKSMATPLLLSLFGAAIIATGFIYSSDIYKYGSIALTDIGILKKEPVVIMSDEDSNSTPPQVVVDPVEKVVQPVMQSLAPSPAQVITQPINKTDVAR